ncbi:hypothetical protein OVW19_29060, partial [Klebsiella pneumoniae]|nr:hypothetical protein [Klebsiella pneumoniae]
MTLAYRQRQVAADGDVGKKAIYTSAGGLEDLRSIKASFDAIIQCVKRKTSPPPIPIPAETTSAT